MKTPAPQLAHEAPGNLVVLSALARRTMGAGNQEAMDRAMRDFASAIRAGSSAGDYLLLAGLHGRKRQSTEAIAVLQKGMRANPYVR
jgi:hypothetical protein